MKVMRFLAISAIACLGFTAAELYTTAAAAASVGAGDGEAFVSCYECRSGVCETCHNGSTGPGWTTCLDAGSTCIMQGTQCTVPKCPPPG